LLHAADRPELRSALLCDPALAELGDYLVRGQSGFCHPFGRADRDRGFLVPRFALEAILRLRERSGNPSRGGQRR
jgi:hypothetical protein